MSEDDQISLSLDNRMSSSAMTQARAIFDEIININTKITIMKANGITESEEISGLRFIRKYLKDRMKYYEEGGTI
tara:strand:- start:7471 stop:7695 length:225 start_codon:yes stop_codon:yes gene_type:complete